MKAKTLEILPIGTHVRISKSHREYWFYNAWSSCTGPEGPQSEDDVQQYFVRKCIALGLRYTATFREYRKDVSGYRILEPGALIEIEAAGMKDLVYISHKDLRLARKKRK